MPQGGPPSGLVGAVAGVAGVDKALRELREVVACLRDPAAFARIGARCPRGILLTGPSGTGKTLLARCVAEEADCEFLSCSGSAFVELFVGRGSARGLCVAAFCSVCAACGVERETERAARTLTHGGVET